MGVGAGTSFCFSNIYKQEVLLLDASAIVEKLRVERVESE
jgi:hypothetical protein